MNTLQNQLQQHKQKSKSPHSSQSNPKPINITKPISPPNNKQNIVTSVSRNDAANALAGLFGAKKSKSAMVLPKDKNNKNYDNDDEKGINLKIKTPSRLEKYMKLGKIMPIHVVENRMKMDGITKLLIGQLTKQWISAIIPDNVSIIDKQVAPPPPMSKEFSDLIEKK
eukprot:706175_1